LNARGRHILIGAPHGAKVAQILLPMSQALFVSLFTKQKTITFIGKASKEDLRFIGELIAKQKLTPVIDRCYKLSEGADAVRYVEAGHARGKVLITPN
jgi:NADPH:quinone reductase-like Zn-dependent oxidoreductase